jgi:hypothetical protein
METLSLETIVKDNNTIFNRKVLYSAFLRTAPGTPERDNVLKQMQFIVKCPTVIPAFNF